jgi:hypothetical protein
MPTASEALDILVPLFGFLAVLGIISRLVRIGRYVSPTITQPAPSSPPRALWGKARRLRLFTEDTALTRAETEYLTSASDRMQAKANLDRLSAELAPSAPSQPPSQPEPAPALTASEIDNLLHLLDLDQALRTQIMQLATSAIRDKHS